MYKFVVATGSMSFSPDSSPCNTFIAAVKRAMWEIGPGWKVKQTGNKKAYIMAVKFDGKKFYMDVAAVVYRTGNSRNGFTIFEIDQRTGLKHKVTV